MGGSGHWWYTPIEAIRQEASRVDAVMALNKLDTLNRAKHFNEGNAEPNC
jgi:hypothetical protein